MTWGVLDKGDLRVVSCAFRVRYAGLYRSGVCMYLSEAKNDGVG